MKRVMFRDLQIGGYSAHTTIEGMFEMHAQETLACSEPGEDYENTKKFLESMDEQAKRVYIAMHEYEIIDNPTPEDIREWEAYQDDYWECIGE